ncbi:MAG: thioredoxin [Clostridiales Family XIII bacterium]|jgi:hypothetical protein|nr:thioredoxin [Clostridiales Family XIII bacterium]
MIRGRRFVFSLVLIAGGVCLLALGAAQGQAAEVMQKAVRVCLECIGIG